MCVCVCIYVYIYIYILLMYMHICVCHISYNVPYFLQYCMCPVTALLNQQQAAVFRVIMQHIIHWSEIPTSLDRWVTDTLSDKMLCPQEHCLFLYLCKNKTFLSVSLLRFSQVFSVSCKIMYQWVMTCCCIMLLYHERCDILTVVSNLINAFFVW